MSLKFHLAAAVAAALTATTAAAAQKATTGNGAPSGSHFNLNIIGVSHDKNPNMKGSGDVIFVGLGTRTDAVTTKILLSQAADGVFEVLDKDGTDGEASFSLPVPAPTPSGPARSARRADRPRWRPAPRSSIPPPAWRRCSARPTTRSSCAARERAVSAM